SRSLLANHLITTEDFYEYVLPYRLNASAFEDWRDAVWKRYRRTSIGQVCTINALIDSCNVINDQLKDWFKFATINGEDTLGYTRLCTLKKGTCVSMANIAAFSLRGLGVPVAIDFVPCWGNIKGSHIWNSLVTNDDKVLPFLGAEGNVGDYNPFYLVGILEDQMKADKAVNHF